MSAIAKAGCRREVVVGDAVWESLRVQVYGSVKAGAGWEEYLMWREECGTDTGSCRRGDGNAEGEGERTGRDR